MKSSARQVRTLRQSVWARGLRGTITLATFVGLLGLAALTVWWTVLRPDRLMDVETWQYCAAWYERSATAAESAVVDAQRPVLGRRYGEHGLSCRMLRDRYGDGRAGRLTTR